MRKLFVLGALLLTFGLMSCGGNGIANQKASLECSIPVAELLPFMNRSAANARATEGSNEKIQVLVQIRNENSYFSQTQSLDVDSMYELLNSQIDKLISDYVDELEPLYASYGLSMDKAAVSEYMKKIMLGEGAKDPYQQTDSFNTEAIQTLSIKNPGKVEEFSQKLTELGMKYSEQISYVHNSDEFYSFFDLTFSFENLAPGKYEVLVDAIGSSSETTDNLTSDGWQAFLSGENEVTAISGQNSVVEIQLEAVQKEVEQYTYNCEIEFSYDQNGTTVTKTITGKQLFGYYDRTTEKYTPPEYECGSYNGKGYIRPYSMDSSRTQNAWIELKSLDYVIKDESHFSKGFDVSAAAFRESYNEKTEEYEKTLKPVASSGKRIPMLQTLCTSTDYYYLKVYFTQQMNNQTLVIESEERLTYFSELSDMGTNETTIVIPSITIKLTGGREVPSNYSAYDITPKAIDVYTYVVGSIPSALKKTFNAQEILTLANLENEENVTHVKRYYYNDESDWANVSFTGSSIEINDPSLKITEKTLDSSNFIIITAYGSPMSSGYTDYYVTYSESASMVNGNEREYKYELTSMGGCPVIFEFNYEEEVMDEYTTAAVIPNLDYTYTLYSTVEQYASTTVTELFNDGYKYSDINGWWSGIFKVYNTIVVDKTNTASGSLNNDNRSLVIEIEKSAQKFVLIPTAQQTITFTAKKADGTSLTAEEAALITWSATLSYDGKDINDYKTELGDYYTVEGNVLTLDPQWKAPLETAGVYQLYVTATWPLFQGATNPKDIIISSQTFNITVEEN